MRSTYYRKRHAKFWGCIACRTLISDIQKYGVRNSDELLSALRLHVAEICEPLASAAAKAGTPLTGVDPDDMMNFVEAEKPFLATCETDCRDARRRIAAAKGPKKKTVPAEEQDDKSDEDEDDASGEA